MGDRTNIADARQHDAEQAAGVIEQAMRNEGLIDKDVRLMGEIITEALDAAGFDVVLRADPDTSDDYTPCPHCNDEGVVCTHDGDIIGPCDCTSDDLFTEARRLLDAATPGPWTRPSPTSNWFTVPQPIQIDEADWGQEAQEGGAMCGYRIGTLADERAWRYADAELIAAAPRLIAALLERAVTAEAEARQLREAIGDPDELRWHRWHCEETGQGDDLRELLVRIADAADAADVAVAEGAEE